MSIHLSRWSRNYQEQPKEEDNGDRDGRTMKYGQPLLVEAILYPVLDCSYLQFHMLPSNLRKYMPLPLLPRCHCLTVATTVGNSTSPYVLSSPQPFCEEMPTREHPMVHYCGDGLTYPTLGQGQYILRC